MFIALEGIDACGKSTQAKILVERLKASFFKFPDAGTPMGKLIYSHLREEWTVQGTDKVDTEFVNAMAFQAMQFSNRLEHAAEISHLLSAGKRVVADRYWCSGIVYGSADGLDEDYLISAQQHLPMPDLNILVDIPVSVSEKRRPKDRDRYEAKEGFLEDVRSRYLDLWDRMSKKENPVKWTVVDGNKTAIEVMADVLCAVETIRLINS